MICNVFCIGLKFVWILICRRFPRPGAPLPFFPLLSERRSNSIKLPQWVQTVVAHALWFFTFSTRICNRRHFPFLPSLIVKLVPNCEFIFTFEYFSNIQIQVSYPLFAYITRYTPKHFPIFVIVHVVEQQDNWNLSYHLNCPNSLYKLSTNLFYVGIFTLLQKLQIHQTNWKGCKTKATNIFRKRPESRLKMSFQPVPRTPPLPMPYS